MCIGAVYLRCRVLIVQGCCVEVLLLDKLASSRVHMQIVTGQCPEVAGVTISFQPVGLGYWGKSLFLSPSNLCFHTYTDMILYYYLAWFIIMMFPTIYALERHRYMFLLRGLYPHAFRRSIRILVRSLTLESQCVHDIFLLVCCSIQRVVVESCPERRQTDTVGTDKVVIIERGDQQPSVKFIIVPWDFSAFEPHQRACSQYSRSDLTCLLHTKSLYDPSSNCISSLIASISLTPSSHHSTTPPPPYSSCH
jgi:hypothetical protein